MMVGQYEVSMPDVPVAAPQKAPFRVFGLSVQDFLMVACECDPEASWAQTWFLNDSRSFDFRCTHCGKAHHIEIGVTWRPLGDEKQKVREEQVG